MDSLAYKASRRDFERWMTPLLEKLFGWHIYPHEDDQLIKDFDVYGVTDYHAWRWKTVGSKPKPIKQTFRLCMRVQWEFIYPTFTVGCKCKCPEYPAEIDKLCALCDGRNEYDFPQWNVQCYGDKRGGNLLYFGVIQNEKLVEFYRGARKRHRCSEYKMPGDDGKIFFCFPYCELSKYSFDTYVVRDGDVVLADLSEWKWKQHDRWSADEFGSQPIRYIE